MIPSLPISTLNKYLSGVLPIAWENFETESILSELNLEFDELLVEKINFLKVIRQKPELFYTDPIFFLHACEAFSSQITDFDSIPHVSSLEAAFAIVDMARFQDISPEESIHYGLGVRLTIEEILVGDGYSRAVWPFTNVGIPRLTPGATEEDMKNKETAIKEYISGTYGKPTN